MHDEMQLLHWRILNAQNSTINKNVILYVNGCFKFIKQIYKIGIYVLLIGFDFSPLQMNLDKKYFIQFEWKCMSNSTCITFYNVIKISLNVWD